jgi:hypothetical protein
MFARNLYTVALFACAACACDDGEPCSDSYGQSEAGLRGGWDANGRSMFGLSLGAPGLYGAEIISAELGGRAIEIFDAGAKGLVARSGSGEILTGEELRGARLVVSSYGVEHNVFIRGATRTFDMPAFVRYDLEIDDQVACPGGQMGVFVKGEWDVNGDRHDDDGFSFACESGAIFKCVSWGYAPWKAGAEVHQACTRLVRADYCGDGKSYTENGTMIWVSESPSFPGVEERGFTREAGWGPRGAVCVDHSRYDAYTRTGDQVLPACLARLPACGEGDQDALLYNGSKKAPLTVCGAE